MKADAIHELITAAKALSPSGEIGDGKVAHFHHLAERASAELAAIPSPFTHFLAGDHRVEVDPRRSVIMVDRFTYSVDVLAGGLITAPGTCISIAETSPGHLTVTQRRIAQCPHGEPLASGCRDCDREHREATA